MSEALSVTVIGPDSLPVPRRSSLKQTALAREILNADLTKDTWPEIFKRAGYSEATALASAKDIRERPGVTRAIAAIQASQVDRAKGLVGFGMQLVAGANIDELSSRDKVFLGLDAVKKGFELGENTEQSGDGDRWKRKARRILRWGYYLGTRATTSSVPPPTD